jgi:hypothetical protein
MDAMRGKGRPQTQICRGRRDAVCFGQEEAFVPLTRYVLVTLCPSKRVVQLQLSSDACEDSLYIYYR